MDLQTHTFTIGSRSITIIVSASWRGLADVIWEHGSVQLPAQLLLGAWHAVGIGGVERGKVYIDYPGGNAILPVRMLFGLIAACTHLATCDHLAELLSEVDAVDAGRASIAAERSTWAPAQVTDWTGVPSTASTYRVRITPLGEDEPPTVEIDGPAGPLLVVHEAPTCTEPGWSWSPLESDWLPGKLTQRLLALLNGTLRLHDEDPAVPPDEEIYF